MKFQIYTVLFTLIAASSAATARASALLECRDAQLQNMSAEQLRDELGSAGARNCQVRPASWGESVACQGTTPGSRAFGLPVREFSADIQRDSGQRSVQIVVARSSGVAERAVAAAPAPQGLNLAVESEESGVTVISCRANGGAA